MASPLQQKIYETLSAIERLDKVQEQLKATMEELNNGNRELSTIDRRIQRKLRDIERLEGLSPKAVFHKILGNQNEELEKVRQGYLLVSMREEEIKKRIKILEYEVNLLQSKLAESTSLKKELEKLKREREEEIINSEPELRLQLLAISTDLEAAYNYKSQVEEAKVIGQKCEKLLQQIITLLVQVKRKGQGPSHRRQRVRRRRHQRESIDRARHLTYQLKHHLNLLDKELTDIGKQITFNPDTSSFTQFSDFFFNNLITDWIMQQQLSQAIESAKSMHKHLALCISDLGLEEQRIQHKLVALNQQRDKILIR